jgi:outer membrane protein OmpA-like peptidoglycan-associated protein
MKRMGLMIVLAALLIPGAAALCGAQAPETWRTDYRRPGCRFEGRAASTVDAWRTDHRRPGGDFTGNAASTVAWWNTDSRRPGAIPHRGDGVTGRVAWWRVDSRRPAWFPKKATMMSSAVDSDGDGVLDGADQCPDTPKGATVDARGCPMDSDGDGVYDGIDQCPDTPGGAVVDMRGCPQDTDGDGVYDGIDKCPDTPKGVQVDATGCTVVTSKKEAELLDTGTLRLENVYFDTNKATLKPESYASLDEAGGILAKWPQLRIEVAGHTDSQGDEAYNQDLSQRRAQAVLDYLLGKFPLTAEQFSVKGYGESAPIADNGTKEGRAQNRRVELKVLNREILKKN